MSRLRLLLRAGEVLLDVVLCVVFFTVVCVPICLLVDFVFGGDNVYGHYRGAFLIHRFYCVSLPKDIRGLRQLLRRRSVTPT